MKKLICLLLAAVSVASLAACSNADEESTTTTQVAATNQIREDYHVPDTIPVIDADIARYDRNTNDRGYTYTFEVDNLDYNGIRNYVKQLEAAGYKCYNSGNLQINKTEDTMPETLPEGQRDAKWAGNLRSFYVAITWYADATTTITFYTYNPFENVTK